MGKPSESPGWWDQGGAQLCEWTSEGGLNGFGSVDADGDPPVIHRARVMAREASGRLRQFGWYRRSAALVPCGMRSCFFIGCAPKSRPPAPAPSIAHPNKFCFLEENTMKKHDMMKKFTAAALSPDHDGRPGRLFRRQQLRLLRRRPCPRPFPAPRPAAPPSRWR